MSKWRKARDVIKLLGIESFELFDCIRDGLTPYDKYGRPIPENDFCEGPGEKYTPEEIEASIQEEMKRELRRQRPCAVSPAGGNPAVENLPHLRPALEERELREIAENYIRERPYFPHKAERSWRHFRLPASCRDPERVIQEMLDWCFRSYDVLKLMHEGSPEQIQGPVSEQSAPTVSFYEDGDNWIIGTPGSEASFPIKRGTIKIVSASGDFNTWYRDQGKISAWMHCPEQLRPGRP